MTIGRITATHLLKGIKQATTDLSRESRVHAVRSKGPLTCKSGCAYCCYQKLLVAPWDGIYLYLYIKATGAWTPALRQKLVQADRDLTDHTHRQWLLKRVPCVFLAETAFGKGTCTVYPVRPSGCISTFATTSDPSNCARVDESHTFGVINMPRAEGLRAQEEYARAIGRLLPRCGGRPYLATTLPGAVLVGEAIAEGLARPDVHSAAMSETMSEALANSLEARFDKAAKEPD